MLGAGLTADKLQLSHVGATLTLSFAGYAGSIGIDNEDGAWNAGVEQVVFGDGTAWARTQLLGAYSTLAPTSGNDTILGFGIAETFQGGLGDDTMTGGGGSDTFIYNAGDGNDRIYDVGGFVEQNDVDRLVLGAGLGPDNLVLATSGWNFTMSFVGQTGSIYVDNFLAGAGTGIDRISFANGTTWNRTQIQNAISWGTTGNNTVTGTTGNDYFDLRGGTDIASGNGGSDIYQFRRGYGSLEINNATASATTAVGNLDFGANITKNDLWLSQSGSDLMINLLGTNDEVKVDGWFGSNGSAKLAEIQTMTAGSKVDSGLSQLVSAMASFASDNPGFNPLTATQMPTDPTLQNALAAAWH